MKEINSKTESKRLQFFSKDLHPGYLLGIDFPKLQLGKSGIHGEGVLAATAIKKGEVICPLFGMLYRMSDAKIDYPKYSYQISDEAAIETANEPAFFNHSCEPNAYIAEDWMFRAIKDIATGEEVLVDYGTVDYFKYSFVCGCGSRICRTIFDGTTSGAGAFQRKMGKYFSPYLKVKFNL